MRSSRSLLVLLVAVLTYQIAGMLFGQDQGPDLSSVPYIEFERETCQYETPRCVTNNSKGTKLCFFEEGSLCWDENTEISEEDCGNWTDWVDVGPSLILRSRDCSLKNSNFVGWEPWPYANTASQMIDQEDPHLFGLLQQSKLQLGDGLGWLSIPVLPAYVCSEWSRWIRVRPTLEIRSQECKDPDYGARFFRWEARMPS